MRKEYRLVIESEDLVAFFRAHDWVDDSIDDVLAEYGEKVSIEFEEINE